MRRKRILFAAILMIVCSLTVGMALAKEDYDFDVESGNVDASVWGRVSYTDNKSILLGIKDVVNYDIHLIGSDKNLITVNNQASLYMGAYKGNSYVDSLKVFVCDQRLNINNTVWKFADRATELRVTIKIDGVSKKRTLTD